MFLIDRYHGTFHKIRTLCYCDWLNEWNILIKHTELKRPLIHYFFHTYCNFIYSNFPLCFLLFYVYGSSQTCWKINLNIYMLIIDQPAIIKSTADQYLLSFSAALRNEYVWLLNVLYSLMWRDSQSIPSHSFTEWRVKA